MPLTSINLSLAQSIKQKTALLHQEVETVLLPRLTSIQSIEEYAAILKMFYGYFHPLEETIQLLITPTELPDVRHRRTSSFVVTDLDELNQNTISIPLCRSLPEIETVPQAFGALYVIEGSSLGGKMIARMLAKNEQAAIPLTALNFFSGYKEATGRMWSIFLERLNEEPETETVIATANETFLQLKKWIEESGKHE